MRSETEAAIAAVEAAQRAIAGSAGTAEIFSKGGRDLVTAADIASEDAIRSVLLSRYPNYPVVGEERGGTAPADGKAYWLVDPICGTRAFASGIPLYAINVALVEGDEAVLCAIGDGSSGTVHTSERDGGAFTRGPDGVVPLRADAASSMIWVDPATTKAGDSTPHAASFIRAALLSDRWYVWVLGTSLSLAYLAAGRIAGLVHFAISSPLHTAAGCLLASEAGAIVTDFDGRPWTLESRAFVAAATPELHRDLLRMVVDTRGR